MPCDNINKCTILSTERILKAKLRRTSHARSLLPDGGSNLGSLNLLMQFLLNNTNPANIFVIERAFSFFFSDQ